MWQLQWSLSASAASCGAGGGDYALAGCAPVVCSQPTDISGYTVTDTELNVAIGFDVAVECDTGFHPTGAGPAATSCGAASGDYTLSGCAVNTCIARTTAVAGFATLPVCEDMSTGSISCSVMPECAVGYTGTPSLADVTCGAHGAELTVIGCTDLGTTCTEPSDTTGYVVTTTELNAALFDVSVSCATGYEATSQLFLESFESYAWASAGHLDHGASVYDWGRSTGSTPTSNTGPSTAEDGSYYLYTEAYYSNEDHALAIVEPLQANVEYTVELWYHMYGSDTGTLSIASATVMPEPPALSVELGASGTSCGDAENLLDLVSPHSSTTSAGQNTYATSCGGNGNEKIFYMDVSAGSTLVIGQTTNSYDSRHETRWGGDCPGDNVVACTDDPDTRKHAWTNDQADTQRVYFIVDAYSSRSGAFTIAWSATIRSTLWSISGEQQTSSSAAWTHAYVSVTPMADSQIQIVGTTGAGSLSDIAIDSVGVSVHNGSAVLATSCGAGGGDYTLTGCTPVVCSQPTDISGYTVTDTELNVAIGFDVAVECDTGFHPTGAGPAATSCGAASGDYTLSGCAVNTCIARTTAVAGFATLPVCEDMSTGSISCSAMPECAAGYLTAVSASLGCSES